MNYGWDNQGNPHCSTFTAPFQGDNPAPNCEYHYHDIWMIPKSANIASLYGPAGSNGESIYYQQPSSGGTVDASACASPAAGTITCLAPNTFTNIPFWGHPAFNQAVNYLVAYSGQPVCAPSGHTCTSTTNGQGVTDMRTATSIYFSNTEIVGHSCWDGYDTDHVCHHGGFRNMQDIVNGCVNEALREVTLSTATSVPFLRTGCLPEGTNGGGLFLPVDVSRRARTKVGHEPLYQPVLVDFTLT
jgi:hypothetical protein